MKKNCIWAITPGGLQIGQKIMQSLPESEFFISKGICDLFPIDDSTVVFEKLSAIFQKQFRNYHAHICIFSTGIAVRIAAPLLNSKLTDPAIVVIDDRAFHAISLVSGHLGGANELTLEVARITGATPVITTATDINHLPSIDIIAKKQNLLIENPQMIKKINMTFLRGEKINVIDSFNLVTPDIPDQFLWNETDLGAPVATILCSDMLSTPKKTDYSSGIAEGSSVSDISKERVAHNIEKKNGVSDIELIEGVPRETLILRPASLIAGMGCNRGTTRDELLDLLKTSFRENNLSLNSLAGFATTSVKEDETGLLELAGTLEKPIEFYDKSALNSVKTIQNPSEIVEKHLGVKSVCEAAAILAAHNGDLILPKIKKGNATLAVARKVIKKNMERKI